MVITTIHPPTPAILAYITIPDVDVIVVADRKTPDAAYADLDCHYLSLARQRELAPEFDELLPFDHYARKNMGYLHAIRAGYECIVESDDDNIPYDGWAAATLRPGAVEGASHFLVSGPQPVNPYQLFTEAHVWPRGLPLRHVLMTDTRRRTAAVSSAGFFDDVSIIQGLADGNPDVDAIFRLTSRESLTPLRFDTTGAYCKVGPTAFCPANTQNTVWRDRRDFPLLYLPSSVSFRFCDILKMYVAQAFLRRDGRSLAFQGATVFQDRNPHDVFADYLDECEMYLHVDRLLALLEDTIGGLEPGPRGLQMLYGRLVDANIVKDARELSLLERWLKAVG
ncbi:MAG: hypothetical protein ACR2IT_06010 [Pirellulales bacterium]